MKAIVYSKENCPYCVRAKALLKKLDIPYAEFIIGVAGTKTLEENQQWTTREELLEKAPNARTVPQIWLGDDHVGGYTELAARFSSSTSLTA